MRRRSSVSKGCGVVLAAVLLASRTASAQPVRTGGVPDDAVGMGVAFIHFAPDDRETPGWFSFDGAAPVIAYTRPGMAITLFRATSDGEINDREADLDLVDASFVLSSDLRLGGSPGRGIRTVAPVAVTSSYRRVRFTADQVTSTMFEYQSLGIGAGLGARVAGRRWVADVRAIPSIAFATRSFGGTTGTVLGGDAGGWVTVGPVVGSVGLSFGYGFSWKRWRVGGPEALVVVGSGKHHYTAREHTLRLGISW